MTKRSLYPFCVVPLLALLLLAQLACSRNPEAGKKRYLESGERYMTKGKYQEASIQYRNALKLDPRFAEAYYQLAKANLAMHDWRDAFAALKEAIQVDPARLDTRLGLGQLYLAGRQYDKAQEEATAILEK